MNRLIKASVLLLVVVLFAVAAHMMMKKGKGVTENTSGQAPVVSASSSSSPSTEPAELKATGTQEASAASGKALPPGTLSEAARIRQEYGSNFDTNRKIDILERLCFIQDGVEDALEVIRLALLDPDPQVRRQALLVLKSNGLFFALDLSSQINAGISDADGEVREAAVALLEALGVGRYPQIVGKLVSSSDPELLGKGMDLINVSHTGIPIGVYQEAMRAASSTNRYYIVGMVRNQLAKRGVPLLIDTLKDEDPEVRAEAQHSLYFLLDQSFETYEQASAWWNANSSRFPNLFSEVAETIDAEPGAETNTSNGAVQPELKGEVPAGPPETLL